MQPYWFCCGSTQTFAHRHTYGKGLLSDLRRKDVKPIALASGTAVRTLQEFLRDHHWHHPHVCQELPRHLAAPLPGWPADDLGTVGPIDETSALRGKNPEVTMAQVCEALNQVCAAWQEAQRGTNRRQDRFARIRYHQRWNRAAVAARPQRRSRPEAARSANRNCRSVNRPP